jgi:indolepyruvate ferredoxin oxidoreductase
VLIACDMVVGSSPVVLKTVRPGHTVAILNTDVAPTGEFQSNRNFDTGEEKMHAAVLDALAGGQAFALHATTIATDLTGDSIGTNILMLGYAAQNGLLPISIASLKEAICLNGSFVEGNLRTFALGRLAAHAPNALAQELDLGPQEVPLRTVDDVLASRLRLLTAYQNGRYAVKYRDFVDDVRRRVAARGLKGGETFTREVALTLARLMAYKDEYEVARLYTDPKFTRRMREQFAGKYKMTFHLAPPMLPGRDASGRPRKREFGPWTMSLFKVLASLKGLRGTTFDIFGYTADRRMERKLIEGYRALVLRIVDRLNENNLGIGIELAAAAAEVRGYGPVKEAAFKAYKAKLSSLLKDFETPREKPQARAA